MRAQNKLYAIIDIEVEKTAGLNKAIVSRFYSTITAPRKHCASMNFYEGYTRYAVAQLNFAEDKTKRKEFTLERRELTDEEKRYIPIEVNYLERIVEISNGDE